MISKYFSHALRAFEHNRLYTIINMVGLMLSLAGCVIIARYVYQELTVDDYIPDIDRTMIAYESQPNGIKYRTECSNWNNIERYPMPQYSEDVEVFTKFMPYDGASIEVNDIALDNVDILASDTAFLDVLPRKIISGVNFKGINEALVTRSMAQRMWADEDALGQTFKVFGDPNIYKVVGVLEDADSKRNFDFDILICVDTKNLRARKIGWMVCRLKPGVDYRQFNSNIKDFEYSMRDGAVEHYHPQLTPLKDVYFDKDFMVEYQTFQIQGNMRNIRILEIVAILLLAVGLFNFLNIYSIVMYERQQSLAIRKSFGAGIKNIFLHIFAENFIVIVLAVTFAWLLVAIATPILRDYVNMTLIPSLSFDIILTVSVCILFSILVSAAACYGIWRNARVHSMGNSMPKGAIRLRRYLLLLPQMVITLILITISLYFMLQVHQMLNADMGFQTHSIVTFRLWPNQGKEASYNVTDWDAYQKRQVKERSTITQAIQSIKSIPEVEAYAIIDPDEPPSLLMKEVFTVGVKLTDSPVDDWTEFACAFIDADVLNTYNIKITDLDTAKILESKYYYTLVNDAALDLIPSHQLSSAKLQTERAIFWRMGMEPDDGSNFVIAGTVNNLRLTPLYLKGFPVVVAVDNGKRDYEKQGKPLVRYNEKNKDKVLTSLTEIYQDINGSDTRPEFEFVEDEIAEAYADDVRTTHIYNAFAILAIVISCLGLFGVVSYDLHRRIRELTIRRVLGAKRRDILKLIIRPYLLVVSIASIISVPIALYAINTYRSNYSSSVDVQPWIFIVAILAIVLIAYATVIANLHSLKNK